MNFVNILKLTAAVSLLGISACKTVDQYVKEDKFNVSNSQSLKFTEGNFMQSHVTVRQITGGAKWLSQSEQERQLGVSLIDNDELDEALTTQNSDEGLAPLLVAVTNKSPYRILMHGSSAQSIDQNAQFAGEQPQFESLVESFDLSKADTAGMSFLKGVATITGGGLFGAFDPEEQMRLGAIRSNLVRKTLKDEIVEPGTTAQGIVFLPLKSIVQGHKLRLSVQNLKRMAYLNLDVPLPTSVKVN